MLELDGVVFEPGLAFETEVFEQTTDLAPGTADVEGAVSSDGIRAEDVSAGLWDGARIDVELADWSAGERIGHIWSGRFSEIEIQDGEFFANLVSLKADLERVLGRNYSGLCDATLGDARCGVDLNDPQHAGLSCDQTFETCVARFNNGERFRGCPHMPGNDFMLASPGRSS